MRITKDEAAILAMLARIGIGHYFDKVMIDVDDKKKLYECLISVVNKLDLEPEDERRRQGRKRDTIEECILRVGIRNGAIDKKFNFYQSKR